MTQAAGPVRVLVTGFGPFPGIPNNASASIALAIQHAAAMPGVDITTAIIPVVWSEARAVARAAVARFKPHAIVHFGVSRRAAGFEIEARAFNMHGPKEDHAGEVRPETPLVSGGQDVLLATAPPLHLHEALTREGFPAAISQDAGRYLCNALFYWSLCDAEAERRLVSFVHLPAFGIEREKPPSLTLEEAVAGGRILVRAAAEAVLRANRNGLGQGEGSIGDGSQTLHRDKRDGGSPARHGG